LPINNPKISPSPSPRGGEVQEVRRNNRKKTNKILLVILDDRIFMDGFIVLIPFLVRKYAIS
jgi:hypothetical protein